MAVLWRVRTWFSIFTRPLAAMLVIVLLGMMSGQGRVLEIEDGTIAVLSKASAKVQILAVIQDTAGIKVAPLAKTPKAVWPAFRSGQSLAVIRTSHIYAPQVVVSAPELPQCPWVGVIVLRV